jgi:hypothetical protein
LRQFAKPSPGWTVRQGISRAVEESNNKRASRRRARPRRLDTALDEYDADTYDWLKFNGTARLDRMAWREASVGFQPIAVRTGIAKSGAGGTASPGGASSRI